MILVAGAGGHIGGHLVVKLLKQDRHVRATDIKPRGQWWQRHAYVDNVESYDLREPSKADMAVMGCQEVYNLATDMGGVGFISRHPAASMLACTINANLLRSAIKYGVERYFYASSSCVYGGDGVSTEIAYRETDAYPANPYEGYGWEKLYGERCCLAVGREHGIDVRIGRLFNAYGPYGDWTGGREKSVPAICRKVSEAKLTGKNAITVWGDGKQTRSYTAMADVVEGICRLTASDVSEPVNIGRSAWTRADELAAMVCRVAEADLRIEYDETAPQGVRGRSSDNALIRERLGWEPTTSLAEGLPETYAWVERQVKAKLG